MQLQDALRHSSRALVLVGLPLVLLGCHPRATLFLWFADGSKPPVTAPCPSVPPPFRCSFSNSTETCKAQVLAETRAIYSGLPIDVSTDLPRHGNFQTVLITSDSKWCGYHPDVAGIAGMNRSCSSRPDGVAVAFDCGSTAQRCATIIAQEHAHLLGLEHTEGGPDIMNGALPSGAARFADQELVIHEPHCGRTTQNSRRLLEQKLREL